MELVVKLPLFEDMPYFYKFKGLMAEDKEQPSVDLKVPLYGLLHVHKELKVIGHMVLPFEPGCTYIASSSVGNISVNGELLWQVNWIDLFFPVLKLTTVKWTLTCRPIR